MSFANFSVIDAQIELISFEDWEDYLNYERPVGWETNQDATYKRLEKSTDAMDGAYALKFVPSSTSAWHRCPGIVTKGFKLEEAIVGDRIEVDQKLKGLYLNNLIAAKGGDYKEVARKLVLK